MATQKRSQNVITERELIIRKTIVIRIACTDKRHFCQLQSFEVSFHYRDFGSLWGGWGCKILLCKPTHIGPLGFHLYLQKVVEFESTYVGREKWNSRIQREGILTTCCVNSSLGMMMRIHPVYGTVSFAFSAEIESIFFFFLPGTSNYLKHESQVYSRVSQKVLMM